MELPLSYIQEGGRRIRQKNGSKKTEPQPASQQDGAVTSFKKKIYDLFRRYQQNSTVIVHIGRLEHAEELVERINVAIDVANAFDFDIIELQSSELLKGEMFGVFRNIKKAMHEMHLHHVEEEARMHHEDGMTEEFSDQSSPENDEDGEVIPRKRRKRPQEPPIFW